MSHFQTLSECQSLEPRCSSCAVWLISFSDWVWSLAFNSYRLPDRDSFFSFHFSPASTLSLFLGLGCFYNGMNKALWQSKRMRNMVCNWLSCGKAYHLPVPALGNELGWFFPYHTWNLSFIKISLITTPMLSFRSSSNSKQLQWHNLVRHYLVITIHSLMGPSCLLSR